MNEKDKYIAAVEEAKNSLRKPMLEANWLLARLKKEHGEKRAEDATRFLQTEGETVVEMSFNFSINPATIKAIWYINGRYPAKHGTVTLFLNRETTVLIDAEGREKVKRITDTVVNAIPQLLTLMEQRVLESYK